TVYGEPLYGVSALSALDVTISTPGNMQLNTINVTNQLKYTAELTPLDLDPIGLTSGALAQDTGFRPSKADDIIYGGLGDDMIHGGSGDDAISGAEALAAFWNNPVLDPLNILGYQSGPQTFAAYDEFNPLQKPPSFFLNFDETAGPLTVAGGT